MPPQVAVWLTSALFYRQQVSLRFGANINQGPAIVADTAQPFQPMSAALLGGAVATSVW